VPESERVKVTVEKIDVGAAEKSPLQINESGLTNYPAATPATVKSGMSNKIQSHTMGFTLNK